MASISPRQTLDETVCPTESELRVYLRRFASVCHDVGGWMFPGSSVTEKSI